MSDKIKAVVCGVNFGSFYISAIENSSVLSLGGILSKGSEKSRRISEKYQVPLFTDADEINDADVVIMAARSMITGGKSSKTVKALLKKGIPVLQEQPVHHLEVKDLISVSEDAKYAVNNFYRFLPSVSEFVNYARRLSEERTILRFRMSCSSQVLYPLMDVLYSITGSADTFTADKVSGGAMSVITGEINGIPYMLDYYNEYTENIDSSLALFFDMKIDTDGGNLILTDPVGDVIWQPHLSCLRDNDFDNEKYRNNIPMKRLYSGSADSYATLYNELWTKAMERSVIDFAYSASAPLRTRHLKQCEMCGTVTKAAGLPVRIKTPYTDSYML